MEALFNCYVAGDYDPEINPNDLIAEALGIAEEDQERAQHLIVQAGAIALHSRPLWWRWPVEAYGSAGPWLVTIANLVEDYTAGGQTPLGPLEEARAESERATREVQETIRELEKQPEQPAAALSPVDDLIQELIEQSETDFTPEQPSICKWKIRPVKDALPSTPLNCWGN